jgi:hypothetical protein
VPIDPELMSLHLADGSAVAIKSDQLVVWMSVTPSGLADFPVRTPRFPVILDTGFNHTFLIGERQLFEWGGLAAKDLTWIDALTADGQAIPLRDADVWIHRNRPGSRDPLAGAAPFRLELTDGIGVWPTAIPGSRRLPLLGTRALRGAKLHADINFSDGWFSLFTGRWLRFPRWRS